MPILQIRHRGITIPTHVTQTERCFQGKAVSPASQDSGESLQRAVLTRQPALLSSLFPYPRPRPLSHCLHPSWGHCHHLLCCGSVSNMCPLASFPLSLSSHYFMGDLNPTRPEGLNLTVPLKQICLRLSAAQKPSEALTILKASQIKPLIIIWLQPVFL